MTLAGFAASLDTSTGILTFTDPAAWTGTVASTAGDFNVNLPAATAAAGLIRIA